MRRGESLYRQTLTSDDGSTLLFQDGRWARIIMQGETSHWNRHYEEQQTVLVLDEDGYLRSRTLDGEVVEQIAGPGAELTLVRGRAELRDEAGGVVWASRAEQAVPVRQPAMPQSDELAVWFAALVGEHTGYCVAVVKQSTPGEVLERAGVAPESVFEGTWRELRQHREATAAGDARVLAAIAVGADVLVLSDDAELPVTTLASSAAAVAALHLPHGGDGYGSVFTLHRDGTLLSEMRDEPRRVKGANVPEVAAALDELSHYLHRHELLFRTVEVIPSAVELGGRLHGGVLPPRLERSTPLDSEASETGETPLVIEGYEFGDPYPFVVRTDFTDEQTWNRVVEQLRLPWSDDDDNPPPEPLLVQDRRFDGAPAERVLQLLRTAIAEEQLPGVVFIADATTMREKGNPLLAVTTEWDGRPFEEDEEEFVTQYRSLPDAAIEISVNVSLGNMDFEEFSGDEPHERWV